MKHPIPRKSVETREIVFGSPEYKSALELRLEVLRRPLGLGFSPGQIADEGSDYHLGAFEEGRLVATLVLTPQDDQVVKMRQVAVDSMRRGEGFGGSLVKFSETFAKARGFVEMTLHARDTAVPFYLRLGYRLQGEPFEEVTIPHREMWKSLA